MSSIVIPSKDAEIAIRSQPGKYFETVSFQRYRRGMEREHHLPTVIGIGLVAYAVCAVVHQGLGHGGACVLVHGVPDTLNSCYFECNAEPSDAAGKWVSAGGTLANLVFAAIAWRARKAFKRSAAAQFFLWIFFATNALDAFGYLMFSGIGGIGDWSNVIDGLQPVWLYRAGLAVAGVGLYFGPGRIWVGTGLERFLGAGDKRAARANALALFPYLAGGVQSVLAGAFNPVSPQLVLISAAAASLGGTSLLAWYPRIYARLAKPSDQPPLIVERSNAWIAAGALTSIVFIVVLGRGIHF
jgi:hypothetical protein